MEPTTQTARTQEQLLLAIWAVQLGFAAPERVADCLAEWTPDAAHGLTSLLETAGALRPRQRAALESLAQTLAESGADTAEILRAFGGQELALRMFAGRLEISADGSMRVLKRKVAKPDPDDEADTMASLVDSSAAPAVVKPAGAPTAGFDLDDQSDKRITWAHPGRYTIQRVHGAGGQARVLLAFDEHTGREVAIKELLPAAGGSGLSTPGSQRTTEGIVRFLREARVTAQLEHPNIIPVYELARRSDGTVFYAMRFVRGQTLSEKLKACRQLPERLKLLGVFWDVCKAVAFAHSRGVVHRDIKPKNIMVGGFDETVVLDWGIAKVRGLADIRARAIERELKNLQASGLQASGEMTALGTAMGTPSYMSPEQAAGQIDQIDERSDVWGLGAMLYEILTGVPPYQSPNSVETMRRVIEEQIRPVRQLQRGVPQELADIAQKALRKDKSLRYRSAKELVDEIGAYLTGEKVSAHAYSALELLRRFVWAHKAAFAAFVLVVLSVVAALLVTRHLRIRGIEDEIAELAGQFQGLTPSRESLEKIRKAAFDAFDRDDLEGGERTWSEAVYLNRQLALDTQQLLTRLDGLLESLPGSAAGHGLRLDLLEFLITTSRYAGKTELAMTSRQELLREDRDGQIALRLDRPVSLTILSQPAGARFDLIRLVDGRPTPVRSQERTPAVGLSLPAGSYLVEATLAGHEPVRAPLLVEPGEERVLSIPLPQTGVVPPGMVYIPPGEFLVGSSDPEDIRRHTGAAPLHRSYTEAFIASRTEVTFAEYLPFWRGLGQQEQSRYAPRAPFRLQPGATGEPILSFAGQSRRLGQRFEFPDCLDCPAQDWGKWPVAVSREAAQAYAAWKSQRLAASGYPLTLRLPSEREWEKAARGADGRAYPNGNKLPDDAAVTQATHGRMYSGPEEVGSRPGGRSVFGLDDLSGNVWEWVHSGAGQEPDDFAVKGASFRESPLLAAATTRIKGSDVTEAYAAGFRLVASLPGSEPCPETITPQESEVVTVALARACRDEGSRAENRAAYDRALARFGRMLELNRAVRGEDHPDTANAYENLGSVYNLQAVYDRSLENLEKALAIRIKVLGPRHRDTASSYDRIGNVLWEKGSYDQALSNHQKALAILQQELKADDPALGVTYNNIGMVYDMKGDYDRAIEFYGKSLAIAQKALGPQHPSTARQYYNLGVVYWLKGSHDLALAHYQKALDVRLKVLGPESPWTADSLDGIGSIYYSKALRDEALKYYSQALAIRLKVLGPVHARTAIAHNNVGVVYWEKGDYGKALEHHRKALAIRLQVLGPKHAEVGWSNCNIGSVYAAQGDYDQALSYIQKALDIDVEALGPEHPEVARVLRLIGEAYWGKGMLDKAQENLEKSIAIYEKKSGATYEETVAAYLDLSDLLAERGDAAAAGMYQKAWSNGHQTCEKGTALACSVSAVARCAAGSCDAQAAADADRAITLAPGNADSQEARAFVLLTQGKKDEARRLYCKLPGFGTLNHLAARKRQARLCPAGM